MSQPAISKHLKVLERAGLITRDRDAQRRLSRLEAKPLAEATEWLVDYRKFWESSFTRLDELLVDLQTPPKKKKRKHKNKKH
jgi:DNA-binding transcriptional ArsR family regulator